MEIKRNGSQPSGKGSSDYFTGTVHIDPLFEALDPALPSARRDYRSSLTKSGQMVA